MWPTCTHVIPELRFSGEALAAVVTDELLQSRHGVVVFHGMLLKPACCGKAPTTLITRESQWLSWQAHATTCSHMRTKIEFCTVTRATVVTDEILLSRRCVMFFHGVLLKVMCSFKALTTNITHEIHRFSIVLWIVQFKV